MREATPTNRHERRARGASSRSESIRWKERHDALMDIMCGILYAKGDGPQHRLAIGNPYFDQPRRQVAVEPYGDRVVIYLEPLPGQELETPSRWARFVARIRQLIRR